MPAPYLEAAQFASMTTGWSREAPADRLVGTRDGGRTWTALPLPKRLVGARAGGTRGIRFDLVGTRLGFVWEGSSPTLWRSDDGGRSWHVIPMAPAPPS